MVSCLHGPKRDAQPPCVSSQTPFSRHSACTQGFGIIGRDDEGPHEVENLVALSLTLTSMPQVGQRRWLSGLVLAAAVGGRICGAPAILVAPFAQAHPSIILSPLPLPCPFQAELVLRHVTEADLPDGGAPTHAAHGQLLLCHTKQRFVCALEGYTIGRAHVCGRSNRTQKHRLKQDAPRTLAHDWRMCQVCAWARSLDLLLGSAGLPPADASPGQWSQALGVPAFPDDNLNFIVLAHPQFSRLQVGGGRGHRPGRQADGHPDCHPDCALAVRPPGPPFPLHLLVFVLSRRRAPLVICCCNVKRLMPLPNLPLAT